MDYLVKSGEFEGPVHLLLQLIQDRKMHVSEVSLAAVTEDFLRYMSDHQLSYSDVSSFIVVASTLVLIKARSLLPQMELTEEEEASIEDLTERVRQYALIQKYAEALAPQYQKKVAFERVWQDRNPVFAPDAQMTLGGLQNIMEGIFAAFPVMEKLPEKAVKVLVRLEEVIENLSQRIQSGMAFHSRDLMDKYRNATDPTEKRQAKVFAVVSFLAILELVKKGIGNVLQDDQFGDIELKNTL
jgi:segregation and condensation protein A